MSSSNHDEQAGANLNSTGFAGQSAKASWITCIMVFVLLAFGRQSIGIVLAEFISLGFILLGICLAIFALANIRRCGRQGILAPALAGLVINGLLLSIFVTNFLAARANARVAGRTLETRQTMKAQPRVAPFNRGPIAFTYDTRYQVGFQGNQGQIVLSHPDSHVVVTHYPETGDMNESLKNVAGQMKLAFEQKHYRDIYQGEVEPLRTVSGSAGKITLKYSPPERSRTVAELYFICGETNATSLLHIFAEDHRNVASSMFQSVLNSLLK